MSASALLAFEDLTKSFGAVRALDGVGFDVRAGSVHALLGENGAGKSTLLTLLGGIQRPSAGRIFLGDQEVSRLNERSLARIRSRRVSTMLQGATRNLLPYATAAQNVGFEVYLRTEKYLLAAKCLQAARELDPENAAAHEQSVRLRLARKSPNPTIAIAHHH